jgi:hypothetical protein
VSRFRNVAVGAVTAVAAVVAAGCSGTGDGGPMVVTLLSIAVMPDSMTLPAVGARIQLSVTGARSDGTRPSLTADAGIAYASRSPAVATVGADGTVVAAGSGATVIVATHSGVSDSAAIVVDPSAAIPVLSLSIAPDSILLTSLAQTRATAAALAWANGARFDGAGGPIAYVADDEAVASVSEDGVIAAVAIGATMVRGSAGGRVDSVLVTVMLPPPIQALEVAPSAIVLPAIAARFQLTVTGSTDSGPIDLTADPTTSYTSRDPSVAAAVAGGSVVGAGAGATHVVVSHSGLCDSVLVTVDPTAAVAVASLSVAPDSAAFTAIGETRATAAALLWENGARFDGGGPPIVYASENPAVATVSAGGVIEAAGAGAARIVASFGGAADTVAVLVAPASASFAADVLPVLAANCTSLGCHGGASGQRGLLLNSYAHVIAGSVFRGVVVPGDGAASLLYRVLNGPVSDVSPAVPNQMPRLRTPLPVAERETIRAWIDEGALDN